MVELSSATLAVSITLASGARQCGHRAVGQQYSSSKIIVGMVWVVVRLLARRFRGHLQHGNFSFVEYRMEIPIFRPNGAATVFVQAAPVVAVSRELMQESMFPTQLNSLNPAICIIPWPVRV
eukprot:5159422-Pyramimonas_sp.AAC.3